MNNISNEVSRGEKIYLSLPCAEDCSEYLAACDKSRNFHEPWVYTIRTEHDYQAKLEPNVRRKDFFIRCCTTHKLCGVIAIGNIDRGFLQSGYMGYYSFKDFTRSGFMQEAISLMLDYIFGELNLHRVEANIQPGNKPSLALIKKCGFSKEGFSPDYLKVGGIFRDHERWAMIKENWETLKNG